MKRIISLIVELLVSPLAFNPKLAIFVKNAIIKDTEHLFIAIDLIKRIQSSGANANLILDVGSYDGTSARFFAKHLKDVEIVGFEPNPSSCLNAKSKNGFNGRIVYENYALDKENGQLDFYVADNSVSSSLNPINSNHQFKLEKVIKVKVMPLDEFIKEDKEVLLLKIDTQGRELAVLSGSKKVLKKTRLVLVEMDNHRYYEGGCLYNEVDGFLRDNGFKLHTIISGYTTTGLTEYDAIYINSSLK
jgi:FkbM family methyltransferase